MQIYKSHSEKRDSPMQDQDFSSLTLTAIQAALKAGDILRKGFGTEYEIRSKPGRQNFVTEYDHASEGCIISFIKERFPSHSFLAEESGLSSNSDEDNILWIIDPLDGTSNFAHHIPLFTISIAAYQKGKGLCGVIFQPLTYELFIAERDKGSYLNGIRLAVSRTDQIEDCLIVASLPYNSTSGPILNVEQLFQISRMGVTLRNLGSAALSLAYVAAGKVDAFWMYNLYPWDLAAGKLLIEEAGGLWTQFENQNPTLHPPSNVLATNQLLHSLLLAFLNR
jgi:myo-inositol-1(or 4)-monophosphatase